MQTSKYYQKWFSLLAMLFLIFLQSGKLYAQDEFELLYDIDKGFSAITKDLIIKQWSEHAKTVNKNPNCLTNIETQLRAEFNKNALAMGLGMPFQAQINYSNCKVEKFFIDTLKNQDDLPHLVIYHISGCADPNNKISESSISSNTVWDKPLVITYSEMQNNALKWSGYDHYGPINDRDSEHKVLEDLMYEENSLILLCEQKNHKIYEIKNATKHSKVIDMYESLKRLGIDMQKCFNSANSQPTFYGRYQTLVEYYKDLEIRYVLVKSGSKNFILVRIINRNPKLQAEITFLKGVSSGTQKYTVKNNEITTFRLDEIVTFDCEFVTPKAENSSIIETVKQIIRKQVTIENDKIILGKSASSGVRG